MPSEPGSGEKQKVDFLRLGEYERALRELNEVLGKGALNSATIDELQRTSGSEIERLRKFLKELDSNIIEHSA